MEVSELKFFSEKTSPFINSKGIQLNFLKNQLFVKFTFDMMVFTDTSWEYINQRPRQIVQEMAKYQQILFVEEPFIDQSIQKEHYRVIKIIDNLIVIKPVLRHLDDLKNVIHSLSKNTNIPVGWFSSATYYPLIKEFRFKKIIYDIENELIRPSDIMESNEMKLIKKSDIIITGSKAEFESKSLSHNNVHWIPSPVDDIFLVQDKEISSAPANLVNPERPIIGYCGLIDSRIDFEFLEKAAINMPFATFVLIGPVLNSGREKLPEHSNICYLNLSKYNSMPSYLKAIDVAMVPIAVNENNRFVSSSIVLKYMAANKPIISTALYDIERDYHHCIDIVRTPEEFCVTASRKLIPNQVANEERWFCYNQILNRNSWTGTAMEIQKLINGK
ncbi:MAG: hypothetical protein H0V01_07480 [Bacteroidetes bacterium]|nr:hypothetical protein [Bacteroidota bacterium]HET6244201.1 hypothetical protein [Bacteroidia bacterium]